MKNFVPLDTVLKEYLARFVSVHKVPVHYLYLSVKATGSSVLKAVLVVEIVDSGENN